MWIARFGASIGKILLTSLITGAVLAALGMGITTPPWLASATQI